MVASPFCSQPITLPKGSTAREVKRACGDEESKPMTGEAALLKHACLRVRTNDGLRTTR